MRIFNIGSPFNEVTIRQLAETMRKIYAEKFRDPGVPLPEIVSVPGESFYGNGYEDSDRRIPDITKVSTLLGWAPRWGICEMLEAAMSYHVNEYRNQKPVPAEYVAAQWALARPATHAGQETALSANIGVSMVPMSVARHHHHHGHLFDGRADF